MATADLTRPTLGSRRVDARTPAEPSAGVLDCAARSGGYDACMRSASRPLAAALLLAMAAGACTAAPGAPSAAPSTSPPGPAVGTSAPVASAGEQATASASSEAATPPAGTTQTPWGRIRDAVPAGFPVYPGATVADTPPGGAVSGAWVSSATAAEVASWYRTALLAARWAKVDDGGALEDGSHVLDVQGDAPGCKAQVTAKPAGESTMISILYGAGCAAG